ncbi:hypothetical protein LTR95_002914 [Oleoguttula sp. CCFEE 5521]
MREITRDREQRREDENAAYEEAVWRQRWSWRSLFGQRRREPDEESVTSYEAPDREERKTTIRRTVRRKPSVLSTRSTTYPRASDRIASPAQLPLNDGRWHGVKHEYETSPLAERLLDVAKPNLFWPILSPDRKEARRYVVSVATMQSVVVRTYQRDLVQAAKEMMDGKTSVLLPRLLRSYCKAIRDMEYMQQAVNNGFAADPFLLQTSKQMEREMMRHYHLLPRQRRLTKAWDYDRPRLPGIGRRAKLERDQGQLKTKKLYYALAGGLSLIIPMLIMRLVPGVVCSLVTTSVAVLLFAIIVARRSSLQPQEILGIVAAYAAVLVVFVGTAST